MARIDAGDWRRVASRSGDDETAIRLGVNALSHLVRGVSLSSSFSTEAFAAIEFIQTEKGGVSKRRA